MHSHNNSRSIFIYAKTDSCFQIHVYQEIYCFKVRQFSLSELSNINNNITSKTDKHKFIGYYHILFYVVDCDVQFIH